MPAGNSNIARRHHDPELTRREEVERITLKIVGWCFVALAVYIAVESIPTLLKEGVNGLKGKAFCSGVRPY